MHIVKSVFIAFSLYSKIPLLQCAWEEDDMKYVYCFFPWVGALIGGCLFLWLYLCGRLQIGSLCRTMTGAAIPLLITGGFHVDGFMDTMDAVHSYQPRERKLEILKDSHIGAFAVIMLVLYGLAFLSALSEVENRALQKIVCGGFFLSRCLCGISAVSFPTAKREGTLFLFADRARKNVVKIALYIQSVVCIGLMLYWHFFAGLLVAGCAVGSLVYYYYRSRREFGGVTGDTAGCFVVLCEGCMVVAAAFFDIFFL
jgi:adenosylcobinamide-GDP ribazoletransferase